MFTSRLTFATALIFTIQSAQAFRHKIGVLSDMHEQPDYVPDGDPKNYCEASPAGSSTMDDMAYFGRLGCDAPRALVKAAMQKLASTGPHFVLMPGDMVGHGIALDNDEEYSVIEKFENYEKLLKVHALIGMDTAEYLTNVPVLPTFGNNDIKWHYQAPDQREFYPIMYGDWWKQHAGNQLIEDLGEVQDTMLEAGYYRATLVHDKLALLSFNSLQFNNYNSVDAQDEIDEELDWLQDQLENAQEGMKFLIMMHIYETAGWWRSPYPNWYENENQERYLDLVRTHRDKILLEVTGHDHLAGLRYHSVGDGSDELYMNKVLFPGLTASSNTQPGFATFVFDDETGLVEELKFHYLDVGATAGEPEDTPFTELPWFEVDFATKFGLKDLSAQSIANLVTKLEADKELAREYMFNRMGVDTQNTRQKEEGLAAYKDVMLVRQNATIDDAFLEDGDFDKTACIMKQSIYSSELLKCVRNAEMAQTQAAFSAKVLDFLQ